MSYTLLNVIRSVSAAADLAQSITNSQEEGSRIMSDSESSIVGDDDVAPAPPCLVRRRREGPAAKAPWSRIFVILACRTGVWLKCFPDDAHTPTLPVDGSLILGVALVLGYHFVSASEAPPDGDSTPLLLLPPPRNTRRHG